MPARGADDEKAGAVSSGAPLRSLLFVPGDSEKKQTKALGSGADALILDLEDSVAEAQLPAARVQVLAFLQAHSGPSVPQRWVRLNSPSSGKLREDLEGVVAGRPDGLVLPKVSAAREVAEVSELLTKLEARAGIESGQTRIIVIATETPQALLTLNEYGIGAAGPRLAALTWGMEDLSAALGVTEKLQKDGTLTPVLELARSLCLIAAAAAGVQAIDGVHANFRDTAGLTAEAARGRRDGFTAKLAIHPDQVPVINAAFSPSAAEVEHARRVVAAFAADPSAGVTSLDGRMLDRPHLVLARRVLELSRRSGIDKA
jgi:citrate lyase subunit beta/citryl-CoA lyase